ncbi:MAG: DNA polymerase Y family protein [Immundisolibacteraceae bacterium]|nr:DNA polymerase Y family protein [Immundisolibacteraceae bacterium]
MLWLCLRFPQLPLEVFLDGTSPADHGLNQTADHQTPDHQTTSQIPAAVVDDQQILVCNQAAASAGVTPGITPATAHTLCGQITIFARDPDLEASTLQRLAYSCYVFTPAINPVGPEWILLEIGSSLKLFGGLKTLLGNIKRHLAEQAFSYRFGLAPTPSAAQLLTQLASKQKAELVDCFDPANGSLQQPQRFSHLINNLPLPKLLCETRLQKQFRASGFTTLGDLIALPPAALGRRFGKPFLIYLQQLTGELADPQPNLVLPPEFDDTLAFSDAIIATDMLVFPMKRMLIALCGYLRGRQLQCQQLTWQLNLTDQSQQPILITFSQPQSQLDHFLDLTRLRLESVHLQAPVDSLGLQVTQLHQTATQTASLFQEDDLFDQFELAGSTNKNGQQNPINNQRASDLIDRLTTRLGADTVTQLACADSHIPEQACERHSPLSRRLHKSIDNPQPLARPLWLLPEPTSIRHYDQSSAPAQLTLLRGPERIEGNWWQTPICRDYYIARHQSGLNYWIYQDRISQGWFIHGLFG